MKKVLLMLFVIISLFLFGCSLKTDIFDGENQSLGSGESVNKNFDIVDYSRDILTLMQGDKWSEMSDFAHPVKGVRFSPYTYVDLDHSMVLYPDDFQGDLNSGTFLWGYTDGAGFELIETKYNYFKKWVYSTGFLYTDQILINQKIARGNNLNNIDDVFPGAESIEYYFDGFDPQYEGLDRMSLTLVFEEYQGYYYLVGVIRGSWTI